MPVLQRMATELVLVEEEESVRATVGVLNAVRWKRTVDVYVEWQATHATCPYGVARAQSIQRFVGEDLACMFAQTVLEKRVN